MLGLCDDGWGVMIGGLWWWVGCDDGWAVIWTIDVFFMSANPGEYFADPLSHPHTQSLLGWRTHQRRSIVRLLTNCTWRRREKYRSSSPHPPLPHPPPTTPLHTPHRGKCGRREWEEGSGKVCVCVCVCVWSVSYVSLSHTYIYMYLDSNVQLV